jgi:predicted homoserine dehydrogenase-like protein
VDYVRDVAPGVFIIIRSEAEPVRETLEYLGQGPGPNYVLYRPYHLTSSRPPCPLPAQRSMENPQ